MSAKIIDGFIFAEKIKLSISSRVREYKRRVGNHPCLAIISVGRKSSSDLFTRSKILQGKRVGIKILVFNFLSETGEEEILSLLKELNDRADVNGILIQLPLPIYINCLRVFEAIVPSKDVEGVHPINVGYLAVGNSNVIPCTPRSCLYLLRKTNSFLTGLNVTILGASFLIGYPLSVLLLREGCSVTILHDQSIDIANFCRRSDVIVAAVGSPGLVKKEWVKPGSTVIDVGINLSKDGRKIIGDVDFNEVLTVAGHITPVPGGVGPLTVAMVLDNTIELAHRQLLD